MTDVSRVLDEMDARVTRFPRISDAYFWLNSTCGKLAPAEIWGYGNIRYADMLQLFEAINGVNAHSEHWAHRRVPDDIQ